MDFTGERFIPSANLLGDEIYFEHLHRYYAATQLVNNKTVLDIACGEGYGTAILAKTAASIIGVDIDETSITLARQNYQAENIRFIKGGADKIPVEDNSIDIVISYETIEHLDESTQELFLNEIKRVLKQNGLLVISTPDKLNYSDRYSQKNEFHIKEFTKDEFSSFLKRHFNFISGFLQGYEIVDAITPENPRETTSIEVSDWERETKPFSRKYLISICSNAPLENNLHYSSVVFQVNRNFLKIMDEMVDKEKHILELGSWGKNLDEEINEKNSYIRQLQKEVVEYSQLSPTTEVIENLASLEREKAALAENLRREEALKKELELSLSKLEKDSRDVRQMHEEALIKIEQKDLKAARQEETITILNKKIRTAEGENEDKYNIISEQKEKIHSLYSQMEGLKARLNEIYESDGWKWLNRYYNLKGRLLPENSKRYQFLKRTFNKIRGKKEFAAYTAAKPGAETGNLQATDTAEIPEQSFPLIEFTSFETPVVSIIIPVYNGWAMTYKCLASIRKNTIGTPYEIILADDGASDETKNIDNYIRNIVVLRNERNLGFLNNCNNAATKARGRYILFLNNDTETRPGWLSPLVELLEKDERIGMTGSKLIYPDWKLQEAGGIIWNDASGWNYGHGQDPEDSQFNYVKEVDYISGAAILIRKDLWNEIGGFDERYTPAYCEDSDLAFEVRKRGYKVVYQPLSEIIHYEGYSHGKDGTEGGIKLYQKLNNEKFREKWKEILRKEHFANAENVFWARDRSRSRKTILVVDHYVPHYDKDAGSKTVFQYLKLYVALGFNVKFIGDNFYKHEPYTTVLQQMGIEVLHGAWYASHWKQWILDNQDKIDYILLNRPHITIKYIDFIRQNTRLKILYYGHDLHFVREMKQYDVVKDPALLKSAEKWRETETYIFNNSDIVLAPSHDETNIINSITGTNKAVTILPYFFDKIPGPVIDFTNRKNILFVGGFTHQPNLDAVLWFVNEIFPMVQNRLPDIQFIIVGSNTPKEVQDLASQHIVVKGFLSEEQLDEVYASARITVIPLRYGAGVKGKTVETLYKAVPLISTPVGVEGLPGDYSFLGVTADAAVFADKICSLYSNEQQLLELSRKSVDYIHRNFSEKGAREIVETLLLNAAPSR